MVLDGFFDFAAAAELLDVARLDDCELEQLVILLVL